MSAGEIAAPASRNSPCPCGSGRRYKDCHGALGNAAAAVTRTSSYRAPPQEWSGLSESEADRLGSLMERALAQQLAGRNEDAARLYREVLQVAPRTHDALHMLGVVELGAGNLEDAERLIREALALRPAYPTITHNLQLVHDAVVARDRALPEQLCERALPLFVELALRPRADEAIVESRGGATPAVHLIGAAAACDDGGGWLLRRLATLLAPMQPQLWATDAVSFADFDGKRAVGIDAPSGFVPRGGVHVFAGVGLPELDWIERAEAERVIVVCTAAAPSLYLEQLRAIACDGARPIELVFTNAALAARFGDIGATLPLPIEMPPRAPARPAAPVTFGTWTIEPPAPLVAGVVGQNGPEVEEPGDVDFLSQLARRAGALAVYDPGRLRYRLGGERTVRCMPRTVEGFAAFIGALDCFVHRSRPWWEEGDGRLLLTAMACGIPVLCPQDSLFAAEIRDGVDGLLYADEEHALKLIGELNRTPAWKQTIGAAARERSAERFDAATLAARYRSALLGPRLARAAQTVAPLTRSA